MDRAPRTPSSAGWKISRRVPSSATGSSARARATPRPMAAWPSCPQACATPRFIGGKSLARRAVACVAALHEVERVDVDAKGDDGTSAVGSSADGAGESAAHRAEEARVRPLAFGATQMAVEALVRRNAHSRLIGADVTPDLRLVSELRQPAGDERRRPELRPRRFRVAVDVPAIEDEICVHRSDGLVNRATEFGCILPTQRRHGPPRGARCRSGKPRCRRSTARRPRSDRHA